MKKSKIRLFLLSLLTLSCVSACNGSSSSSGLHTVKFQFDDTLIQSIQVKNGKRIEEKIDDYVFPDASYRFTGWYKDRAFSTNAKWKFDVDIVTSSFSLYAGYQVLTSAPSMIQMKEEAYTSTLLWTQTSFSPTNECTVKLYPFNGASYATEGVTLKGTPTYNETLHEVTFVPETLPQGGLYKVGITTEGQQEAFQENLLFQGAGSTVNPYLVATALDVAAINATQGTTGKDKIFSLYQDIEITTNHGKQANTTFEGTFIGNGKSITITQGGCGFFYKLGKAAVIDNVVVKGAISTGDYPSIGAIANYNEGTVKNSISEANVTSTSGPVADMQNATLGGAGGLIGHNASTGKILNSIFQGTDEGGSADGVVKATIGGGCIVGTNEGLVDGCLNKGCFGAYNSVESGKSLSSYSYSGGIAGFNYGTITNSSTRSVGKLLAQRYTTTPEAGAKNNIAIGGITGYNAEDGTIDSCLFEGIRVHADQAVGGIAGINAGKISNAYAGAKYFSSTTSRSYIGGRVEIGGIAGRVEASGQIENCFSTANVFGHGEKAYAVASKANNSVYISTNHDTSNASYGSPVSNDLLAPIGTNNVKVTTSFIAPGSENAEKDYGLAQTYLSTLGDKFYYDTDDQTIRLVSEKNSSVVEKIKIIFMVNGSVHSNLTVEEGGEGSKLPSVSVTGFTHEGWAITAESEEITFTKTALLTYADVQTYAVNKEVTLYAVLKADGGDPVKENTLIVGYISNKVSDSIITNLEIDFADYLFKNTLTIDQVTYRKYEQTKVADYCAAILNDGDVDIVLGVGNNIDSSIDAAYFVSKTNVSINSDTSRYVAVLNLGGHTENANHMMTYLVTPEASAILNPAVRTASLVVAIWSKYAPKLDIEALRTAFDAYLASKSIVIQTIEFKTVEADSVKACVDLMQADLTVDVLIGGGANIGSTAGTNGEMLSVNNTDVNIGGSTRKASVLNRTTNLLNATDFIAFLATPEALAILNPVV